MAGSLATRKMLYRLLSQYPLDTKFAQMVEAVGLLMDETDEVINYLLFGRYIDTAEGVHLDRIGVFLGYPRGYQEKVDGVFTYKAVTDINRADRGYRSIMGLPFGGVYASVDGAYEADKMGDDDYRALLYIRARAITSDPDIQGIYTWLTESFNIECTLSVPEPMVINVTVTSGALTAPERYLIENKSPALPGVAMLIL